eukprot:Plantae.Rhodophyta-Purpureofilum_apyrenoidigerum.ctg38459.p1 GENE.Plantae.Rhodophyta-Purpureofilum_apyrenoidigerum.ctg38459~~Plantae.Rhodophyta-Purpureofilum_apyrenoidigerum.ctg38459.p1  ORF type:complete len:165 (-),score=13.84 Plantae.Rhodophyta-Purpureofilum_apyrenoidigerum.ctg38459:262-756(-)
MDISRLLADEDNPKSESEPGAALARASYVRARDEAAASTRPPTPESWPEGSGTEKHDNEARKREKKERGESSKTHKCRQCTSSFTTRSNLVVHVQTVHQGLRPYTCDQCGRNFGTKGTMNRHVRLVHYHERRYVCDICTRAFATLACLRRHHGLLHGDSDADRT